MSVLTIISVVGILTGLTNVRVGPLQLEDLALLVLLGFCISKLAGSAFSFRISTGLTRVFWSHTLFLLTLFSLAVIAVRLTFYPLDEASFLRQPIIFSFSRLVQLGAIVCGFLWLTNVFIRQKSLLISAMNVYWWTGIVCALYGILSYVTLSFFPFSPPAIFGAYINADNSLRLCGFFNEGGPFGLYIISVFVIGLLRRHMTGRRLGVGKIAILSVAMLLSQSKFGLLAAVLLGLYFITSAVSFKKKAFYFVLATAIFLGVAAWLDLGTQLVGYLISYQNIEEEVSVRGNSDYNLVIGRVSALHIVPKMIAAHPVTGIGFGNYPLMRNDPLYLGGLPTVTEVEDLPGLGIPGIAAELGIPATLWLLALLFIPYRVSRGKATILVVSALFQPLAHILAVQLTFFYPWFVSACALAASYYEDRNSRLRSEGRTHFTSSSTPQGIYPQRTLPQTE